MVETSNLASLLFFTVSKYHYTAETECNFANAPRPHFCMGLVTEGRGVFTFRGGEVTVEAGDIIFVPAGSRYISHWTGEPDVTYISMHFSFFSNARFPGEKTLSIQKISPCEKGEFDEIFARAFRTFERGEGCNFSSLACFYEAMCRISPRLVYTSDRTFDERIAETTAYLEGHYAENTSTASLAAIAHMSTSHFHATFKRITGMTPIEYRNSIRVRYAIMSLIRGDQTVEAISEALGFESVTYFRRVFKKETGCPPSKYNKKHMEI